MRARLSSRALAAAARPEGARSAATETHPRPNGDPLDWIEGRWVLEILLCLNVHERRFSDLRAAIPRVSANILTDRLRALENAGLVERRSLPPPSASQVYALAEPAAGLRPVSDALADWRAEEYDPSPPARIEPSSAPLRPSR